MNICVIGAGYVGRVVSACLAETGNQVIGVDVNEKIVSGLNSGSLDLHEPGLQRLIECNMNEGRLRYTTSVAEGVKGALFVFLCVQTPADEDGSCDLTALRRAAADIGRSITDYTIVVNKSTVPVGTADMVRAIVSDELKKRGEAIEFDVASNPEFLKEGDAVNDFMTPDRVVVGVDNERAARYFKRLYEPLTHHKDILLIMDVKSAEMTKYAANCMLASKISFINEIALLCERLGADVRKVRLGIGSDSRIGFSFIYPGIGYGGSCFPKDVKALIKIAEDRNCDLKMVKAVHAVNDRQKGVLGEKIRDYFKNLGGLEGKTLALWGLAFKAKTEDMREAPSLDLIEAATSEGMKVRAFDPAAEEKARAVLADNPLVEIRDDQYEVLDDADCLAVATDWNQFKNPDFQEIRNRLARPVIFDGRNLWTFEAVREHGLQYFSIGASPVLP